MMLVRPYYIRYECPERGEVRRAIGVILNESNIGLGPNPRMYPVASENLGEKIQMIRDIGQLLTNSVPFDT